MSKDPQELLARWASDEILNPYGPLLPKDVEKSATAPPTDDLPNAADSSLLLDDLDGHFGMSRTLPLTTASLAGHENSEVRSVQRQSMPLKPEPTDDDTTTTANSPLIEKPATPGTEPAVPSPEQTVESESSDVNEPPATIPLTAGKRSGGALMVFGQILAYIGVLSLTIGGTFVVWGYFGQKANVAPLGWLIVTAGQMLLFLGIMTLVSGGLEQTTSTLESRLDVLSHQILRIEQTAQARGQWGAPTTAASRYAKSTRPETPPEAAA